MGKRNLQRDIRVFLGIPPYNNWNNHAYGDGYFLRDCENFWGKDLFNEAFQREMRLFKEKEKIYG